MVLKAIARDPSHRYQTPAEMAEDLKRFVEDRPVKARRVSEAERLWRWCRRNPGVAVLGGALAAVLVLATVASLLAARHFNRLRLNEAQAAQSERAARFDYAGRSGLPLPPGQMRGAARDDFTAPEDMRVPAPLRTYGTT